jgi:hypothetical protein
MGRGYVVNKKVYRKRAEIRIYSVYSSQLKLRGKIYISGHHLFPLENFILHPHSFNHTMRHISGFFHWIALHPTPFHTTRLISPLPSAQHDAP